MAQEAIGNLGNETVKLSLAKAIEECIAPIYIRFAYCNLDRISQQLLADAVAKNKHLTGFSCFQNPYNFDASGNYMPESDEVFKMAIITSPAPLKIWNNSPLTDPVKVGRSLYPLLALRLFPHIGVHSPMRKLPSELFRLVAGML
jgi:hypothetical protein